MYIDQLAAISTLESASHFRFETLKAVFTSRQLAASAIRKIAVGTDQMIRCANSSNAPRWLIARIYSGRLPQIR